MWKKIRFLSKFQSHPLAFSAFQRWSDPPNFPITSGITRNYTGQKLTKQREKRTTTRVSFLHVCISGNPKPNVHWWRNDELLDQTFEFFEDKATNILFLERVGRKNVDDKLSCRATNSKLTKMVTAAVSVNLYRKYIFASYFPVKL